MRGVKCTDNFQGMRGREGDWSSYIISCRRWGIQNCRACRWSAGINKHVCILRRDTPEGHKLRSQAKKYIRQKRQTCQFLHYADCLRQVFWYCVSNLLRGNSLVANRSASSSLSSILYLFRLFIWCACTFEGLICGLGTPRLGEIGTTSLLIVILDFDDVSLGLEICAKFLYLCYEFIVKLKPGLTPA